jgi:MFS family permease
MVSSNTVLRRLSLGTGTQQAVAAPPDTKAKWHALAAAFLGEAFDAMDASIFFIAMYPAINELLGTKNDVAIGQVGSYILATFMMGWFFGAFIFGALADRIGRRKVLLSTILLYSVATGLCAMSHTWVELAAYRFFVGLGIGGEICLGTVIVSEYWHRNSRLWATCALESSFNAGLLLCSLANFCFGDMGWRVLFLVGIVPALFTLYIRSGLKESSTFKQMEEHKKQLRAQGDKLSAEDAVHLQSSFHQLFSKQWRMKLCWSAALSLSAIVGYWACVAWMPAWINQLTGNLAVDQRSMATTIFSAGGLIGCFSTPFFAKKLGRRLLMRLSFGGALVSTLIMFLTIKEYGMPLLVWSLLLGIFTNLQFAALQIYIPEVFPTSILATAAGICYGGARIFSAALALVGSQLIAVYGGSFAYASATISLVYIIGVVASLYMTETDGEALGMRRGGLTCG